MKGKLSSPMEGFSVPKTKVPRLEGTGTVIKGSAPAKKAPLSTPSRPDDKK